MRWGLPVLVTLALAVTPAPAGEASESPEAAEYPRSHDRGSTRRDQRAGPFEPAA